MSSHLHSLLSPFADDPHQDTVGLSHHSTGHRRHNISGDWHVLIADDDPVSRSVIANICSSMGATCQQVASCSEANWWIANKQFDFAVLDLNMPPRNGLEVLRTIRQTYSEVDMPVIIVTSDCTRQSAIAAFELGANDYINKPFDSSTAIARIRTHLRMQQMQLQLSESILRYQLAMQGTNDGMWDWDLVNDSMYYSPRWQAMLGLEEHELFGSPDHWFDRIHEDDRQQILQALQAHLQGETTHLDSEMRMRHSTEEYRWMLCRGRAIFDQHGRATRMAGSLTDVTDGKSVDALTGLPNRALFVERLMRRFAQFKRNPSRTFAMLYIDVDDFKLVNDTYGHAAGDSVLASLAGNMEQKVRRPDSVVARLGGDEFAILLEDLSCQQAGRIIINRIEKAISTTVTLGGHETVTPTASLGLAFADPSMKTYHDLLDAADKAMYQAKRSGKHSGHIWASAELVAPVATPESPAPTTTPWQKPIN